MTTIEKSVLARLTISGEHFEVYVDPDRALEFKKGSPVSIENMLSVREIFKDAHKGERASSSDLEKAFKTTDIFKVAEQVIRKGEVQLTTEQRRKMVDEKRNQIADIISKQGINPQNKLPHPQQRILNAMEESRVQVDPFKPADGQVNDVLKAISPILPIFFEKLEIAVKVPMQYAGKASAAIHQLAAIKKEEWKGDGWLGLIEIPAGLQGEIYAKISELTNGTAEVKIVSSEKL